MSTRCQIGFYAKTDQELQNPDVLLYRHWDGYPEAVVPEILPFLRMFNERRGLGDTEYAGAWLMWHLIEQHVKHN